MGQKANLPFNPHPLPSPCIATFCKSGCIKHTVVPSGKVPGRLPQCISSTPITPALVGGDPSKRQQASGADTCLSGHGRAEHVQPSDTEVVLPENRISQPCQHTYQVLSAQRKNQNLCRCIRWKGQRATRWQRLTATSVPFGRGDGPKPARNSIIHVATETERQHRISHEKVV